MFEALTVEVVPKDKVLEHTVLFIKTISSSGIVRPKAQIRTKMFMKNVISTNQVHPETIKINTRTIAIKISPPPKMFFLTTETPNNLIYTKN